MRRTREIAIAAVALSSSTLAFSFFREGIWAVAGIVLILGSIWIVGQIRNWWWVHSWGFVGIVLMAAIGAFFDVQPIWLLSSLSFALIAWDLGDFLSRLRNSFHSDEVAGIERHHLIRVIWVGGLGVIFAGIALRVQFQLSFGWAFLLVLFLLFSLSRWFNFLLDRN